VQYFLKVTPREDCEAKILLFGLPFKTMRIAMCKAYAVDRIGYTVSDGFLHQGIGLGMARSLLKSRCCTSVDEVRDLMARVQVSAALYRCASNVKIRLGGLDLWPIPLDKRWQSTPWVAQPMVCIRPDINGTHLSLVLPTNAKSKGKAKVPDNQFKSAVAANCKAFRYFTHSYTLSTLGADEYEAPDDEDEHDEDEDEDEEEVEEEEEDA
jgi:hypothetical protein